MKSLIALLLLLAPLESVPNDSSHVNETEIARAMRMAVREADSTLLKKTALGDWRDYVKLASMQLEPELRPLVLIKFDEDVSFRNQFKKLIEWEYHWLKRETDFYLYYYRWDQPPPDIIVEVQDAHCRALAETFQIEFKEKIPYRYDLTATESTVYPFDDLRGGIVSPHPFDLEKSARAIFNLIGAEPFCLIEALARIYGTYYQNPSTAEAYYHKCLQETQRQEYVSIVELFSKQQFDTESSVEWYSSYCFAYKLNQTFSPPQIAEFLSQSSSEMSLADFRQVFDDIFGVLPEKFEQQRILQDAVNKI